MSYALPTATLDFLPVLPQTLTSQGYSATIVMITNHITRADSVINSKVGTRYDISSFTTATSTPPLLTAISQDIASYFTLRSMFSGDNQNVTEWAEKFEEAKESLTEIREGNQDLLDTAGNLVEERTTSQAELIESNTENYQSFFDEDDSTNWKVDTDKLDNIDR